MTKNTAENVIHAFFEILKALKLQEAESSTKNTIIEGFGHFSSFWNFFVNIYLDSVKAKEDKALGDLLAELEDLNFAAEEAVKAYKTNPDSYLSLLSTRDKIANERLRLLGDAK